VYHLLQSGARFWGSAWDRLPSKVRGPGYGYSDAKRPIIRRDRSLLPPALPALSDLAVRPVYRDRYAHLLAEAPQRLRDNDRLLARLHENIARATRNRYNLEVFLSIAYFQRHSIELLLGLGAVEGLLIQAGKAHEAAKWTRAVGLMIQAHEEVGRLVGDLYATYDRLKRVWEKSRFPKGRSVGDRHFVHVMDTVKDHPADRRPDLSYLIAPEESIGLPAWRDSLRGVIESYAFTSGVAIKPLEEERLED